MRRGLLVLGALLTLAGCNFGPTLEPIRGGENITVKVIACEFDPTTGLASATFDLTSEEEYGSVLLRGELSNEAGIVIGTGTGAVSGIDPGKTYRDDIVFSLTSEPQGDISCDVSVELANPLV